MRPPEDQPGVASRPLSVTELNTLAKTLLEEGLPALWVEGGLSRPNHHASGHLYFTLQDAGGRIDAVMLASRVRVLRFRPADGMQARARGRVTVFPPQGRYQ